jgi:hypothetical protein
MTITTAGAFAQNLQSRLDSSNPLNMHIFGSDKLSKIPRECGISAIVGV